MDSMIFIQLPILLFSIIVHEYSHGAVADYFGDDTARLLGRLTFNPIPHIDPMGSIVIPILCLMTGSPIFGWAKPVPVNESRLRGRLAATLVSAAGPLSNFFLAVVFACGLWLALFGARGTSFYPLLLAVLQYGILINLYLCVFNLIPIPPLDGSRVLSRVLPESLAWFYQRLEPYGFLIIMLLLAGGFFPRVVSPIVFWMYQALISGLA